MERFRTMIEPFRIHAVEPIRMTTREQRAEATAPWAFLKELGVG